MQIEVPQSFIERAQKYLPDCDNDIVKELAEAALSSGLSRLSLIGEPRPEPEMLDELTGCLTWRRLKSDLSSWVKGDGPQDQSVFQQRFLCLNIRQFKIYVDAHGMPQGNEVLRTVGQALCRKYERVYRTAGEKFAAVLGEEPVFLPELPEGDRWKSAVLEVRVRRNIYADNYAEAGIELSIQKACSRGGVEETTTIVFEDDG